MSRRIVCARDQVDLMAAFFRLGYDIQSPAPGEPMRTKTGPYTIQDRKRVPTVPSDPNNDPMAHLDKRPYDYSTMVDNLVSHYNGASDNERKQGRFWYRAAHDLFHSFAKKNGISPERAVAMGAAFSPLTDWGDNVNHAQQFMLGYTPDDPRAVEQGLFNEHDWQMSHIAQEPLDAFRQQHGRNPTDSDEDLHLLADLHQGKWNASQAEIKKGLPGRQDIANNPEARRDWMENIQHHGIETVLEDQARQSEGWAKDPKKKGLYNPRDAMRAAGINTLGGNIQKAKDLMHAPDDIVSMFKVLGGPKISHFTDNILDDTDIDENGYYRHPNGDWTQNKDLGGTIDSHHIRAVSMAHGQWQQLPYSVDNPSTDHEYDVYNRGLYDATKRINDAQPDRTKHITPKQLQAIVWLKHKNDKDYFSRQRNPLTNTPIAHESELGGAGRPEDWQFADKSYKSRSKAAALDENDFASMPPLWRKMFMGSQPQDWTELLAAWVEHHHPDDNGAPLDREARFVQSNKTFTEWIDVTQNSFVPHPNAASRSLLASVNDVLSYSSSIIKRSIPEDAATNEDWGKRVFEHVMRNPDGMTFHDQPGDGPTSGFMVSLPRREKHEERIPFYMLTPGDFNDYGGRKRDVVNSSPQNNMGGWLSPKREEDDDPEQYPPEERHHKNTPLYYLDVSENERNPWDAATKAESGDQEAVFNLDDYKEYPTDEMMMQTHWGGDPNQPGYIFSRRQW